MRTGGTDDLNLRVLGSHRVKDHLESLAEARRDVVFIADTKIFQPERFWMPGLRAFCTPGRRDGTVGPLDQIQHLLDESWHVLHRNTLLT